MARPTNERPKSVLVVEDEYLLARDMCKALLDIGATPVGPVGELSKALQLARETPALDAAIMDVNLHGQPAYPLADFLMEAGVPIILATGYDSSTLPEKYRSVKTWQKPLGFTDLQRLLQSAIAEWRSPAAVR